MIYQQLSLKLEFKFIVFLCRMQGENSFLVGGLGEGVVLRFLFSFYKINLLFLKRLKKYVEVANYPQIKLTPAKDMCFEFHI